MAKKKKQSFEVELSNTLEEISNKIENIEELNNKALLTEIEVTIDLINALYTEAYSRADFVLKLAPNPEKHVEYGFIMGTMCGNKYNNYLSQLFHECIKRSLK